MLISNMMNCLDIQVTATNSSNMGYVSFKCKVDLFFINNF